MCCGKVLYFLIHVFLHFFAYLVPYALCFLWHLITFLPCRQCCGDPPYIYRPKDELRVIHNREYTEVAVEVFGMVDVQESLTEDRQYCCDTEEDEKKLKKEAKKRLMYFDTPQYNGHISTIVGFKRLDITVEYERQEIRAWDGCSIALDWLYVDGVKVNPSCHSSAPFSSHDAKAAPERDCVVHLKNDAPVGGRDGEPLKFSSLGTVKGLVVILPGLTSDSQTVYIKRFALALHNANYHVCVVNTRGFGGPSASKPFVFNGAYTKDFRNVAKKYFVKSALIRRFGYPMPVLGLGLSNGGSTLSKYVGEAGRDGQETYLDAAFTCCAPNDFVIMAEHMNRGTMQKAIYQPEMCNDIRQYFASHEQLTHAPNIDYNYVFKEGNINRFTRVVHFDKHIFSKTSGYRSVHQYHMDASPVVWLPYTPIPTLVLAVFDDPIIGRTVLPHRWREMCDNNPRLVSVESHYGGHLGFLGGPIDELCDRPNWAERFFIQRMDATVAYWRRIQESPNESNGLMELLPAGWSNTNTSFPHEEISALSQQSSSSYMRCQPLRVNSPYFSSSVTPRLPKQYLYHPYFSAPATAEHPLSPLLPKEMKEEKQKPTTVNGAQSADEFNQKSRCMNEVLRSAVHVPVLVNCDYYIDPRVYMIDNGEDPADSDGKCEAPYRAEENHFF